MWNDHVSTGIRGKHHGAAEAEYHKSVGSKKQRVPP